MFKLKHPTLTDLSTDKQSLILWQQWRRGWRGYGWREGKTGSL